MRSAKNKIALIVLIMLFGVSQFTGCGYTTRSMVDPNMRTIYIEPFINEIDLFSEQSEDTNYRTYYPLLERDITNKVVDRFVFDGNLKVVKKLEADVVLKGKLLRYQRDPVRYEDNDEDVKEYRISLITDITLMDNKTQTEVWHEANLVGDTTYFVTGTSAKSESAAIADAINDLAKRIVERLVENW